MEKRAEHLPFLDHLRGFAILSVFLYHSVSASFGHDQLAFKGWFADFHTSKSFLALLPVTFGWSGVCVFFVVSGFCIHLSYVKSTAGDWRTFFVRRFFRIYPPYCLALLFFAVLFPFTRLAFHSRFDWAQLGSHLLLVHNLNQRFFFGINGSFWSVATEVQLYLIYPLLLVLVKHIGWRRTLITVASLEIAMRGLAAIACIVPGISIPPWFSASPFGCWYSWTIGAALAQAYVRGEPLPFRSFGWLWMLLAIASSFIAPWPTFTPMLFCLATVSVMSRILQSDHYRSFDPPAIRHLRQLGTWSYSFYLLHQPIVNSVPRIARMLTRAPVHPLVLFILCVATYPLVALLSAIYYRQCEMRSISFGKRFLRRKPQGLRDQTFATPPLVVPVAEE